MKTKVVTLAISMTILGGCAGSANHKVLTAHEANDASLSCEGIHKEIVKAQFIIDEVNKDKDDVSGKDIIDGVLWFPFNLIAKSDNYSKSLEAADKRIATMQDLQKEKGCIPKTEEEKKTDVSRLSDELNKLYELRKNGVLTDSEYKEEKKKVLINTSD